ncbi:hypothetical protein [Pseudemcibacter aquimaris]|uniref:hypothetical protein n=1 Tax=Pseudemcibacter aquimaris TaxID=2857064 RepID=UPI0020135872|nr:hypothetical protein [Pseudemcibacter aquimaris]MCC3859936.1 hypothetical protein [Pseudemcibacter aquimaris]WDU57268.1 hypothetical protein KW060_08660 [Pseudemcibacter aquimaris]
MKNLYKITIAIVVLNLFGITYATANDFKPSTIDFDQDLNASRLSLKQICESIDEREFNPPEIPGTKESHVQLDCQGFMFEGQKRLAEFVFRDGKLALVWVLLDESVMDDMEVKMIKLLGEPSHVSAEFTAFSAKNAALIKEKTEVVFYAPMMSEMFDAWFANPVM